MAGSSSALGKAQSRSRRLPMRSWLAPPADLVGHLVRSHQVAPAHRDGDQPQPADQELQQTLHDQDHLGAATARKGRVRRLVGHDRPRLEAHGRNPIGGRADGAPWCRAGPRPTGYTRPDRGGSGRGRRGSIVRGRQLSVVELLERVVAAARRSRPVSIHPPGRPRCRTTAGIKASRDRAGTWSQSRRPRRARSPGSDRPACSRRRGSQPPPSRRRSGRSPRGSADLPGAGPGRPRASPHGLQPIRRKLAGRAWPSAPPGGDPR